MTKKKTQQMTDKDIALFLEAMRKSKESKTTKFIKNFVGQIVAFLFLLALFGTLILWLKVVFMALLG